MAPNPALFRMQAPQPQPQNRWPFCSKSHPLKQLCSARLEALAEAWRSRQRPFRHGKHWPGAPKPGSAFSTSRIPAQARGSAVLLRDARI